MDVIIYILNNMETNKYYTPSIEEFYVGFEFEILNRGIEWSKTYYGSSRLALLESSISELINKDYIRVKYLDSSDIESLGFKYRGRAIDLWFEMEGDFQIGNWTSYKIILHYGNDHRLYIEAMDNINEERLFQGTINNKSELIKILKQIGV